MDELTWIKDILKEIDQDTPISSKPSNLYENQAPSGRRIYNSALHGPWPVGMAEKTGLRAAGLEINHEGWDINLNYYRSSNM